MLLPATAGCGSIWSINAAVWLGALSLVVSSDRSQVARGVELHGAHATAHLACRSPPPDLARNAAPPWLPARGTRHWRGTFGVAGADAVQVGRKQGVELTGRRQIEKHPVALDLDRKHLY